MHFNHSIRQSHLFIYISLLIERYKPFTSTNYLISNLKLVLKYAYPTTSPESILKSLKKILINNSK